MGNLLCPEEEEQPFRHILCYGDSNTWGFRGTPPGQNPYGKRLEQNLNSEGYPCEVTICGNCGFTAKQLWETKDQDEVAGSGQTGLTRLLNDGDFDLVIIMLGTNGLNMSQEVPEILEYTQKLHGYCHERGVKTMAVAGIIPNPDQGGSALVSKYHMMAEGLENYEADEDYDGDDCLGFADPEELVSRTEPGMYADDNMHFTQQGLDTLADELTPLVIAALDKSNHGKGICA